MTSTLKIFNNQLVNLGRVLVERFPENKELKLGLTGIETLKNCNPKKNIEMFTVYGYKYRDHILKENESFFVEEDLITSNFEKNEVNDETFDIMKTLKENWNLLEINEKTNIWKYLKVLIKLNEKYIKSFITK